MFSSATFRYLFHLFSVIHSSPLFTPHYVISRAIVLTRLEGWLFERNFSRERLMCAGAIFYCLGFASIRTEPHEVSWRTDTTTIDCIHSQHVPLHICEKSSNKKFLYDDPSSGSNPLQQLMSSSTLKKTGWETWQYRTTRKGRKQNKEENRSGVKCQIILWCTDRLQLKHNSEWPHESLC